MRTACKAASLGIRLIEKFGKKHLLVEAIATLNRRVMESMDPNGLGKLGLELMETPVPGSQDFCLRTANEYVFDPIVNCKFQFSEDDLANPRLHQQTSQLIARLVSIGDQEGSRFERKYLIRRLSAAMNKDILTSDQSADFRRGVFTCVDQNTGLPIDTGCRDVILLQLPESEECNDLDLLRNHYATQAWPTNDTKLLEHLSNLRWLGMPWPSEVRRSMEWKDEDLNVIARNCLAVVRIKSTAIQETPVLAGSIEAWTQQFSEQPSGFISLVDQVCAAVLLNREELPNQAWDSIVAAAQLAKQAGCPLLKSYPSLACFDSSYSLDAECEIVEGLTSGDTRKVQRSFNALCDWIGRWNADRRFPNVPPPVISVVIGLMESGDLSWMDHAWNAFASCIRHFPRHRAEEILNKSSRWIDGWAARLKYRGVDRSGATDEKFQTALPDLRESFTKLCKVIVDLQFTNSTATNWLSAVADDPMPEIQRVLAADDE